MKRSSLLGLAVVVIAGCNNAPEIQTHKVAFVLPQGWSKAISPDKKVAIGVPPSWRYGADRSMTSSDLMAGMGGMGSGDSSGSAPPEAGKVIEELAGSLEAIANQAERAELERMLEKGIILNCVNSSKPIPGEERTHFYVKRKEQGSNWTWTEAEEAERGAYTKKPQAAVVKLPVGEARRSEENKQLVDGANYTMISYIIINGKNLYSLRFVTVESPEQIRGIEKAVAESLRIE